VQAPPVEAGQRLRLDAGAGQVREFSGEAGQAVIAEVLLAYPKPGCYTVSLDLLDGEGFWLATLAEAELEIATPDEIVEEAVGAEGPIMLPGERTAEEAPATFAAPWLPYRNIKSKPGGARTYSAPGGGAVRRWVGAGTWLSVRRETVAGGARWYQTAGGDWIKADAVVFFEPSELRGVTLDATAPPPPPPPPPPPGERKGVVTASVLNVRARPGVSASNPPIASLRAGAQVVIYEEAQVSGENWYRIGAGRWVAARYIRLIAPRAGLDESRALEKMALPFGWVVPDKLDVRSKPGLGAGSIVVDQLEHYRVIPILEEATVGGARWYRIGDERWVEARQVGVARRKARPASIGAETLWVAVNLSQQTVVCYEGDRAVYAALAATGLPGTPTVQGIFRTWRRLDTGKMSGPGYYIEDVTWTCYFYSGYALHTAYWHDKFGRPRSHGCVNLSPYDAWWIYQWSAKGGANSPTVYVYWA
jgi:lipoprotein-anchoring transpeptidase ErfK/SrfK